MITVHSIPDCYKCRKLKRILKNSGLKYQIVNNSKKPGEMPQISYKTTWCDVNYVGLDECKDFLKTKKRVKDAKIN